MRTITALLTNKAYDYPTRGARRRRKPVILACLHQTANAKASAIQERNYANRAGSKGPPATAYIDRDGTVVRAIDPAKYAAWCQGDVAKPRMRIPTIAAAVASGGVTDRRARPTAIAVLGSTTCEDTAVVTSRLRALGVPFADVDIDADATDGGRRRRRGRPRRADARGLDGGRRHPANGFPPRGGWREGSPSSSSTSPLRSGTMPGGSG